MKRTVKAWLVVLRDGSVDWSMAYVTGTEKEAEQSRSRSRERTVPCTITYDDGKPAKKKGAKK